MRFAIIIVLVFYVSQAIAKAIYYVQEDEMTDQKSYLVLVESDNFGDYRFRGKAKLIYNCSLGKSSIILKVPSYLSKRPSKLQFRFDKEDPYEYEYDEIFGTTDSHGIVLFRDSEYLMGEMIRKNKAVARAYDWEGVSEAAFKFNLSGVSGLIKKANLNGRCLSLEQINEQNTESYKRKQRAIDKVESITRNLKNSTINVKASEWFSLSPEAKELIEKKVKVIILNDNDPEAISLIE